MSEPAVVSVMGSCISRDNFNRRFNPGYKKWYAVGACTNQSSMIALVAPPVDMSWEPKTPMKRYGRWNMNSDLSKEIWDLLAADPPDFLVLDFFGDVHFGALATADGRIVTNNRWRLHKTDLYERLMAIPGTRPIWWRVDREEFLREWREAIGRFAEFMAAHCPTTRIIVHRGFNVHAQLLEDGLTTRLLWGEWPEGHPEWVNRSNELWSELDTYAIDTFGWESIELGPEWWTTHEKHPWGPSDVHYTPDYNHRFLAEMHAISVMQELPEADAGAVQAIRLASRERVRAEARFWEETRDRLAARRAS
ncbi:MAG TPA: DUF6270 domain-containing protein, partial [Nocardioides sp.]|nr:DUF6270 domain-containing protein [Nocardioides sp.]